jgi:hypothetical protein
MIISNSNRALAINAWDGATHGTVLRLHNGCEPANPDCTWTYSQKMLISDRDSSLAINAWGGAQHGTVLRLHEGCRPDNPDCTWTYREGMFVSDRDPSLAINAWEGAQHGTILQLHEACISDNPDCTWVFAGSRTDDDLGVTEQGLTRGTPSIVPSWVVEIRSSAGSCSASVLSEHYLLTAAHCVDHAMFDDISVFRANAANSSQRVYTGKAMFTAHPDYERGDPMDAEDDIALVFLRAGAIDLSLTGRAKMYIDYENPIWTSAQSFTFAGWGLTDPTGGAECTSGEGVLRIGTGAQLQPAARDAKEMNAPRGAMHTCDGDSGSPWLFARAGDYIAFAVTTGWVWEPFVANKGKATTIFPKRTWIYEASVQGGCTSSVCYDDVLSCGVRGTLGELAYEECFERRVMTGEPPPLSMSCPQGRHCCEPGDNQCDLCIPVGRLCP